MNKEDSSPSLRWVDGPKAEIFVEMFRTKLQSLVWNRHVGGPLKLAKNHELSVYFSTKAIFVLCHAPP